MDALDLPALAAARAQELPGSELTHPFGPEADVYKVRGRVFMLVLEARGAMLVNLKAVPEDGAAPREAYPAQVTPGYHMSKRHWISLGPPPCGPARRRRPGPPRRGACERPGHRVLPAGA